MFTVIGLVILVSVLPVNQREICNMISCRMHSFFGCIYLTFLMSLQSIFKVVCTTDVKAIFAF